MECKNTTKKEETRREREREAERERERVEEELNSSRDFQFERNNTTLGDGVRKKQQNYI
jgi:hypothetical protein